ncbi:nuclear transport factor 2 family protein [Aliikangiella sp. G2MR2-5]|uniref:nuclear transport factor 2 family protein n=1 Tax=Aliikangiella sp. G2MR2-5 TaxID=2788943 RepID=UPI0018A95D14|nr:nuclear transport factor 2 family protein [Aliikangiella sp. G2MR2-5]
MVCLLGLLGGCISATGRLSVELQKQIEREVRQSFDALVSASKALESKKYFDLIDAEKFIGLNADGSNWNSVDDLKALIEPGFNMVEKVDSIEFTNVKVSVIDQNTVILVNEYQQSLRLKNGEQYVDAGGGTQVWSKSTGKWLLVSISASSRQ